MAYAPALELTLTAAEEARFWSHVRRFEGCWTWQARRNARGYGVFSVFGKSRAAHRVIFAHTNGPIPEGLVVCHRCDFPACVRPDHLFLGSPRDNTADSIAKGRFKKVTPLQAQTHCRRGHELTVENSILQSHGTKRCRICKRATDERTYQRRKQRRDELRR